MINLSDKKRQFLSVFLLVFGLVWIGVGTQLPGGTSSKGIPAPQEGFKAPDFTLSTPEGDSYTLSELEGRPILINLWASWCGPCRQEMPAMQKLYEEYEDDGFIVLAVNTTQQDNYEAAVGFANELGLTFPILMDIDGYVSDLYQLRATPTSFFVDTEGIIQEVVLGGPMAEALLVTQVENLLKEGN